MGTAARPVVPRVSEPAPSRPQARAPPPSRRFPPRLGRLGFLGLYLLGLDFCGLDLDNIHRHGFRDRRYGLRCLGRRFRFRLSWSRLGGEWVLDALELVAEVQPFVLGVAKQFSLERFEQAERFMAVPAGLLQKQFTWYMDRRSAFTGTGPDHLESGAKFRLPDLSLS